MDTNPTNVFDVQRLAVEQIQKASGYVTALQKPLKKVYFPFKKNLPINPPLPFLKIVAGPQFIAFSSSSQTPVTLPANTLPQFDKYFTKESIVSTAALKFSVLEKNKKIKGAFVPLDKESRIKHGKECSELFFTLDDKEQFLTCGEHPPLFICVVKASTSKQLDAHVFVCPSDDQAVDIVKTLKGELTNEHVEPPSNQNSGHVIANETNPAPAPNEQYPFQQTYPMTNPQFYPQPHPAPAVPAVGSYEQMFYNMHLGQPPNMPYPLLHPQPPYPQNPPMDHMMYGGSMATQQPVPQQNFYQELPPHPIYPNQIPQKNVASNQGQYNPAGTDGSILTIPRPVISGSCTQPDTSNFTDQVPAKPLTPNFQRSSRFIQPGQYPTLMTNQPLPPNAFQNPHLVLQQTFSQQNLTLIKKPNFQFSPPPSTQPENKYFQPGETAAATKNRLSMKLSSGEEQISPPFNPINQQPPTSRSEQIRPNVPAKPVKPTVESLHNDVKYDIRQPKKVIGVRVMPIMPGGIQSPPAFGNRSPTLEQQTDTSNKIEPDMP